MKLLKSNILLISLTSISSILFGAGQLGRNVDTCVYANYGTSIYNIREFLGGLAVTLTYSDIYYGQLITAILLLFSLSTYIFCSIKICLPSSSKGYQAIYSYLISLSILSTWPFYNFITNALRQGIGLSFTSLLLSLQLIRKENSNNNIINLISIFLLICMSFSHKSSLYIGICFILSFLIYKFLEILKIKNYKKYIYYSLLITLPLSITFSLASSINTHGDLEIIGANLGPFISVFCFLFLIIIDLVWKTPKKYSIPLLFIPFHQFVAFTIITIPYNSAISERLFTYFILSIIPYSITIIFTKIRQKELVLISYTVSASLLTFISGIYTESYYIGNDLSSFCQKFGI